MVEKYTDFFTKVINKIGDYPNDLKQPYIFVSKLQNDCVVSSNEIVGKILLVYLRAIIEKNFNFLIETYRKGNCSNWYSYEYVMLEHYQTFFEEDRKERIWSYKSIKREYEKLVEDFLQEWYDDSRR